MGEGFSEDRRPITRQRIISAEEVEGDIRERIGRYSGEALIKELTSYCLQTVVEVVMTKHHQPHRIGRLDEDEAELLRELSSLESD